MITDKQLDAAEKAFRAAYLDPGLMRHALKKALEAADKAAWQPIETAPKDRWILGCGPHEVVAGRFLMSMMRWEARSKRAGRAGWQGWVSGIPTYWKPLPAPPESAP